MKVPLLCISIQPRWMGYLIPALYWAGVPLISKNGRNSLYAAGDLDQRRLHVLLLLLCLPNRKPRKGE
jgi:hypothetical protein